jgi:hypothetical protein
MAKRKRPTSETRRQRLCHLIEERRCGLLPTDLSCSCPKRGGPEHPRNGHPGKVGHLTCSGCKYYDGPWYFKQQVCTHPRARQTAAQWLAEALRRWEEAQAPKAQPTLF